jgi:hypothetical protein
MIDDGWITKTQAAEQLGCDARTIERRARAGRIGARARPGFPTLYLAADVEKLKQSDPGEVRTGLLESAPAVSSNGNGAVAHRRDGSAPWEGPLTQVLLTVLHTLTHPPTGPTGPTVAPTGATDSAYVDRTAALAIAGLSDDELRKAVRAGEVKVRGRRYRRKDLEQL